MTRHCTKCVKNTVYLLGEISRYRSLHVTRWHNFYILNFAGCNIYLSTPNTFLEKLCLLFQHRVCPPNSPTDQITRLITLTTLQKNTAYCLQSTHSKECIIEGQRVLFRPSLYVQISKTLW